MVKKSILAKVGDVIDYKLIRDGYKTGKGNVVVTAEMDTKTVITADVPSTAYASNLDYEVVISGENPPIINIKSDITCPDDTVISKGKYLFYDIGQEYNVKNSNDVIEKISGIKDFILSDNGTELTTKLFDYHYKTTSEFVNNTNKVGNIIVNELTGVASEFTSSANLKLKKSTYFTNERKIYTKVKTGNVSGTSEFLWNYSLDKGVGVYSNHWRIWDNGGIYSTSVSPNTSYWTCVLQNTSGSTLYVLQDDGQYTSSTLPDLDQWTNACSTQGTIFGDNDFCYGGNTVATYEYWTGTIDLLNSWVDTDGEKRFLAYFTKPQDKASLYINPEKDDNLYYEKDELQLNVSKVGSCSISESGIASNFSNSDYLDLGNLDFSGDYEIVLKFKMPETDSDTTSFKPFFDAKATAHFNIAVTSYKDDNKRRIHSNSGDGSSWYTDIQGNTPLELNTEYYVKVVRSGTTRTMYLSTDNTTWSTEGSVEDTYNYSSGYCLGAASYMGSIEIFKGTIDLTKSYIQIGTNEKKYFAEKSKKRYDIPSLYSEFIDTITIPAHVAYEYVNGEWKLSGDSPLITPDEPTVDPSALKFGDRIDNKATIVGTFESNDGKKYAFAVLDSAYYGQHNWASGLNGTDTGLPNYATEDEVLVAKESATYNTDYILNNYSDKETEAFAYCRSIEPLNFNGKKYNCRLPNAYELKQIYNNSEKLYELDPTTSTNASYNLANWEFNGVSDVWSSNECNSDSSWELQSVGVPYNYTKNGPLGVIPIIEIPLSK